MNASDLEQELADSLADEISKTIDFEIISQMLIFSGWTRFDMDYGGDKKWLDVIAWAGNNCTGEYREHNGIWLFENTKDAVLFKLKWI